MVGPLLELISDTSETRRAVLSQIKYLCNLIGQVPFSVCVCNPLLEDCPVVGVSQAFLDLYGLRANQIIGQNCRVLMGNVPEEEVSSKVRLDCREFCVLARVKGLCGTGYVSGIQRNSRANGDLFWNCMMLSFTQAPLIIGLQADLGFDQWASNDERSALQQHAGNMHCIRSMLRDLCVLRPIYPVVMPDAFDSSWDPVPETPVDDGGSTCSGSRASSNSSFRADLLVDRRWLIWPVQNRAVVTAGGTVLQRRGAGSISRGALGMTRCSLGYVGNTVQVRLRIAAVNSAWGLDLHRGAGLPTLGMTLLSPCEVDEQGGVPTDVAFLGRTLAFMGDGTLCWRRQADTFVRQSIFSPVPQSEVLSVPCRVARPRENLQPGNIIEMAWAPGSVSLRIEGNLIACVEDNSITGPVGDVYLVADCAFAVSGLLLC
mmetsp:Transcript_75688/g.202425  ORF Transcript_75688/g.202425 Transcript_75688/m.202425 type:complete len:430 (-) Transcript_75688:301-1590(-)